MQILINGTPAAIKSGSSFEYIAENRLFSGADGYTFEITFPLRDHPGNKAIFGDIHRPDVDISRLTYDCEIRHRSVILTGTLALTGVSDTEVTGQFLQGRSEQNFSATFDKVYINELDLGQPYFTDAADLPPVDAWDAADRGWESVALPWVNNSSSGVPHNFAEYDKETGAYSWSPDTIHLTWQPYLLWLTQKMCETLGYTHDFTPWEEDPRYNRLIICNTLPEAWDLPGYAAALPHWTLEEYFEKLELFLDGEFDIDHRARTVTFDFTSRRLEAAAPVLLENVTDEYTLETKAEDPQCGYSGIRNLAYKDPGHATWKYHSCDWFITSRLSTAAEYDTIDQMLDDNRKHMTWNGYNTRGSNLTKLLYVRDRDMYFIIRAVTRVQTGSNPLFNTYKYTCVVTPVNLFGPLTVDPDNPDDADEIEFVPARIDWTEDKYGSAIFLDMGSYDESSPDYTTPDKDAFHYTGIQSSLVAGEKTGTSEYFSQIHVAYWAGMHSFGGLLPHPHVENIEISPDWKTVREYPFNLRLNDTAGSPRAVRQKIHTSKKAMFKFLSDTIPDPRAIFHIRGKRYICEKITATFTEKGITPLLKGEFWQLAE